MSNAFTHRFTRPRAVLLAVATAAGLSACGLTDPAVEQPTYQEQPIEQLYNDAMAKLDAKDWKAAATAFEEVERQHPYSIWATKALLMSAYAYYENNKYDEAIIALDRFIELHPGHRDIAYAYYMKGLSYYEQINDIGRDQRMTELAMQNLREVVNRFPESKYARDARLKIDLTVDHLAGKDMEIGRYYLRQRQYNAAINRFQRVVDQYQTTTHVPEALHRLVEAYTALGLSREAKKVAAVLGHNFPGSQWYMDSYRLVGGDVLLPGEQEQAADAGWFSWLPW